MPSLTRLATVGTVALSLFSAAKASNHHQSHQHAKRQNNDSGAVVGPADQQVVARQELRELQQDTDAWNLFILAMNDFSTATHEGTTSYFSLAGIHGMPYQPWNGVQGYQSNLQTGYCNHAMPTFITWHRPYVVLWEQTMLEYAQNVVNQYSGSDKTRMQAALGRLRYPYFDPGMLPPSGNEADAVPESMTSPTITVTGPTGSKTIPNPLYSYNSFNPHPSGDFSGYGGGDWDSWPDTLRYPSSTTDSSATSQEQKLITAFQQNAPQIRAQFYRVLTACNDFLDISNDGATSSSSSCNIDLESIHNGIHSLIGGGGHMSYNNWAAYDASFFLHHANIDRIFAMWQALHPDAWMPETTSGSSSTFTIPANTAMDGNYPLAPFKDASGNDCTSNSVRDTTKFHYTYPELQSGNLLETVNNLYGKNAQNEKLTTPSVSSSAPSSTSASSSSSAGSSSVTAKPSLPSGSSSTLIGTGKASSDVSAMSSAISSAMSHASSLGGNVGSMVSSALAGASTGLGSDSNGHASASAAISSALNGASGLGSGVGGMVSSILGGVSSVMAGAAPTASVPTGLPSGMLPSGVLSGAFPTATGGLLGANGTLGGLNSTSSSGLNGQTPTSRSSDYYAHCVAERHGLGTSFNVYAFLGPAPSGDNPLDWMASPNYCGLWANFASVTQDKMLGHLVTGSVVLTPCLAAKVASGDLKSMDESDVVPYMTKNLNWLTATSAGQTVQNNQVPGLTVGAITQKIMPASNGGSLPTYGQGTLVPAVTHGKAGGYQTGMTYNWWDVCKAE